MPQKDIQYYYDNLENIFKGLDFKNRNPLVNYKKLIPVIQKADLLQYLLNFLKKEIPHFEFDKPFKDLNSKFSKFEIEEYVDPILLEYVEDSKVKMIENKYLFDVEKKIILHGFQYFIQYSVFNERVKNDNLDLFTLLVKYFDWSCFHLFINDSEGINHSEIVKLNHYLYSREKKEVVKFSSVNLIHSNLQKGYYQLDSKVHSILSLIYKSIGEAEILIEYWKGKKKDISSQDKLVKKKAALTFNQTYYLLKEYFITPNCPFDNLDPGSQYYILGLLTGNKPETISGHSRTKPDSDNDRKIILKKWLASFENELNSFKSNFEEICSEMKNLDETISNHKLQKKNRKKNSKIE